MNNLDYWQGQQAANWAYQRDLDVANARTNEWIAHANELKAQLNKVRVAAQAEAQDLRQRVLFEQANATGLAHVVETLVHALAGLNPASPLLRDETRERLKNAAALQFMEQHGYRYDSDAGAFRKTK